MSLIRQHWKLFGGIALVYILVSMILVGGLAGGYDYADLKDSFIDELGQLTGTVALFGLMVGSTGNVTSGAGTAYQMIIFLVVSLATIWALRKVLAGEKVSVRDAFYKGTFPLVPFTLVLLVFGLCFIPALMGAFMVANAFGYGIAVTLVEQALWVVLMFFLTVLTLYLVSSVAFALYIVTLPDMRPMAALGAARKLVQFRRWEIIRKLLFLPLALIVTGAIIILPLITIVPGLVEFVFSGLVLVAVVFTHTYVYSLYKELL